MRISPLITGLLITLLLSGCQQAPRPASVPQASQLAQLSSLISSASWLRQHCNRSDIPQDDVLASKALELAAQRGWHTGQAYRQQLARQVSGRLSALDADTPSEAEKCTSLNQSASAFIHFSRQGG